ncbi:MAG TPA: dihydrolipoamide acetyltransferase family protein [Streptosporangiaceae bacterium]|jgi:pyruvate dehydrogenase E2 component (dihydrolipoamide acetyltransferase)
MAHLLRVPEIAAGTTEAVLAAWPVAENSPYSATDVIATVETAKAVIDIEAEENGVILCRLVPEGADVAVGQPIALIGAPGESAANVEDELRAQGITPPVPAPDSATSPAAPAGHHAMSTDGAPERIFISPIARRLARMAGLDLRDISGTGPNGRIMRRDVERAVRAVAADQAEGPPQLPQGPPGPPAAETGSASADYREVPHSRIRRAIASRLTESKQPVPHFYLSGRARAGRLLRLRAELNEGTNPVRISLNDLVIKAVARAHQLVPAMNVVWTPDAVRSFTSVDVGVAIASPRGLVTPVLRSVDRSGIAAIAAATSDMVERAGSGRLAPRELEGGTTTVTNLGMFGVQSFAAIINPPQSSILAVGAVHRAPVVKKGKLAVGSVMEVTLSVDHRAVDGSTASEWMRAFVATIQHPTQILL